MRVARTSEGARVSLIDLPTSGGVIRIGEAELLVIPADEARRAAGLRCAMPRPTARQSPLDVPAVRADRTRRLGLEHKEVELSVLIIKTPSKKFLTVLGMLETAKHKTHEANLVKILASIKPKK
jgi:hypothetical protein